jgi:predicted patatin/cPLA2 family phospholipase
MLKWGIVVISIIGLSFIISACIGPQTTRENSVRCAPKYIKFYDQNLVRQTAALPVRQEFSQYFKDKSAILNNLKRKGRSNQFAILVMSGGGQNGAYGAGFLNGWSEADNRGISPLQRSELSMITAVSTGAMALTYVLAGNDPAQTTEANEALRKIYTEVNDKILLEKHWAVTAALFKNSLVNTEGLGEVLLGATDQFFYKIKNAPDIFAFVGMVNMDDGGYYVVDVDQIARDAVPEDGLVECYREVILASSAEPVGFPPRFINGSMYVDGGLRYGMFWDQILLQATEDHLNPEIYVIINGYRTANPMICDKGGCAPRAPLIENALLPIAERSMAIAKTQLYDSSLARIYWNLKKNFPNQNPKIKYTYIEEGDIARAHCQKTNGQQFDQSYMQCLYKIGFNKGRNPKSWLTYDFMVE